MDGFPPIEVDEIAFSKYPKCVKYLTGRLAGNSHSVFAISTGNKNDWKHSNIRKIENLTCFGHPRLLELCLICDFTKIAMFPLIPILLGDRQHRNFCENRTRNHKNRTTNAEITIPPWPRLFQGRPRPGPYGNDSPGQALTTSPPLWGAVVL